MRRILWILFLAVTLCTVILARRGLAEPACTADEEAIWVELRAPLYDGDVPA